MKRLLFLSAILLTYSCTVWAKPNMPLVVIAGDHEYEYKSLPRKGNWIGLYCGGSGCEIRKASVAVLTSRAKTVLGESEKVDVLSVKGKPLALFHGLKISPGPVVTWLRSDKGYESSHYERLHKAKKWHIPYGARPLTFSKDLKTVRGTYPDGTPFQTKYFEYSLSDGSVKQLMFEDGLETNHGGEQPSPIVHWVGDLDGDGKIDLLMTLPGESSCGFDARLYLSSMASDGGLIGEAAQFSGQIPTCGC